MILLAQKSNNTLALNFGRIAKPLRGGVPVHDGYELSCHK